MLQTNHLYRYIILSILAIASLGLLASPALAKNGNGPKNPAAPKQSKGPKSPVAPEQTLSDYVAWLATQEETAVNQPTLNSYTQTLKDTYRYEKRAAQREFVVSLKNLNKERKAERKSNRQAKKEIKGKKQELKNADTRAERKKIKKEIIAAKKKLQSDYVGSKKQLIRETKAARVELRKLVKSGYGSLKAIAVTSGLVDDDGGDSSSS